MENAMSIWLLSWIANFYKEHFHVSVKRFSTFFLMSGKCVDVENWHARIRKKGKFDNFIISIQLLAFDDFFYFQNSNIKAASANETIFPFPQSWWVYFSIIFFSLIFHISILILSFLLCISSAERAESTFFYWHTYDILWRKVSKKISEKIQQQKNVRSKLRKINWVWKNWNLEFYSLINLLPLHLARHFPVPCRLFSNSNSLLTSSNFFHVINFYFRVRYFNVFNLIQSVEAFYDNSTRASVENTLHFTRESGTSSSSGKSGKFIDFLIE